MEAYGYMVESILNFGKDNFAVIMHEAGLVVGQNILNYLVVKGHDLCNLPWNVHQNLRVGRGEKESMPQFQQFMI